MKKREQTNEEIRSVAKASGFCLWQVAEELGMRDSEFSRAMRHEFEPDEKENVLHVIEKMKRRSGEQGAQNA